MSGMLRPLSFLYDQLTQGRNALYDRGVLSIYRSKLPVVSIGNLTVGGTGKTPLTSLICQELKGRGLSPVVLSRGYRGHVRAPHHVSPHDSPAVVGDEPRMLAQQAEFPVVVSPDRVAGAKFIEQSGLGTIIVLDDGMQHRRLARDFEVLSIDCSSEDSITAFSAGRLLPEGRFREDRDRGLKRAQAVILNARRPKQLAPGTTPIEAVLPPSLPVFRSFIEVHSVVEFRSGQKLPDNSALLPFCALGNPQGFVQTVASLGRPMLAPVLKPDHAAFSTEELTAHQQAHPEAALICSSKDAIKLSPDIALQIYVLKVDPILEEKDRFVGLLAAKLEKRSKAT